MHIQISQDFILSNPYSLININLIRADKKVPLNMRNFRVKKSLRIFMKTSLKMRVLGDVTILEKHRGGKYKSRQIR